MIAKSLGLIRRARKIQAKQRPGQMMHVSFVLQGDRVISYGLNDRRKTHPQSPAKYRTIHSELAAVLNIPLTFSNTIGKKYQLANLGDIAEKLTIVNVRLNKQGQSMLAKPCKTCEKWLVEMGFKEVFWSIDGE